MKRANRFLSMLLAVILVVCMVPISAMTAFAAVGDTFVVSYGDLQYKVLSVDGTTGTVKVIAHADYSYTGDITIPAAVTNNGIAYTVTAIGDYAFMGDSGLTSVTIPGTVTSIGYRAFMGCTNLTSVTIPNGVTSIGKSAFEDCTKLTAITIPGTVTSIGVWAFQRSGLKTLTIQKGVTSIGEQAFVACGSLTIVNLPSTITSIEWGAFSNCSNLETVIFSGSQKQWDAIEIENANDPLSGVTRTYGAVDITFDTDGGSAVAPVVVTKGGTLSTLPTTTKANYKFDGWFTEKTGGTQVTESTQFTENKTIYAHWTPKTVPTASDFDFTPPANLTYDGAPKTATVTVKDGIAGMGEITVKYEPAGAINADTYIVKIDVAEGTEYLSATNITDATWTFTILPAIPANPAAPTATAITYGQTLTDSVLTAGWVWADNAIVPTVENSGYTAYYAISDDTNYDWSAVDGYNAAEHRLERTVTIAVAKTTPIVDPKPTASRVIIGGKLSDATLTGGTASVPGTFAWKDGTQVLDTAETVSKKVVFTPDDTDNYNTVEMDVEVTVVLCDTTSGEHDYTEQRYNADEHWIVCAKCGVEETDSREDHKGGTATCTAKAKCSVCGEGYGKMLDHKYEWIIDKEPTASETGRKHEECTVCKDKRNADTVIPKTETNTPQTGDNSNMALWFALLFVGGMGTVAATVYGRKKSQAR